MRQFYTLYEQDIDVSEEDKMKEIEAFIKKYHLDYKQSPNPPKARVIWEFFILLIVVNIIVNLFNWNLYNLIFGFVGIGGLYICAWVLAKNQQFNIKVN